MPGIKHHTIADDRQFSAADNPRGQQRQFENFSIDYKGMTGIVTALKAGDDIRPLTEPIHDFAFSLIAPLGADYNDICHDDPLLIPSNQRCIAVCLVRGNR